MDKCIFCKIVKGEIPSYKVYEDEMVLAFLDIAPAALGHTLIIPKEHFMTFLDTDEKHLTAMNKAAKIVGHQLIAKLGADGFNLTTNNGRAAGQAVDHTHFHLIPRYFDDPLKPWPHGSYQEGEAEEILKKLM